MKLNKNFIEELIRESLEELQEEEVVKQGDQVPGMQQVHASIANLQKRIEDLTAENESLKAQLEQRKQQQSAPPSEAPDAMKESFQITKGRLRQIISEEMANAKKQGLI